MADYAVTLFASKDACATPMLSWMLHKYGTECLQWDPASVELQLREDLGIAVPNYNLDKIQAASSLLTSNLFHVSLESFANICLALHRGVISPDSLIPANMYDVAWGVTEGRLLEGPDFDKEGFGHNIAMYVGTVLDNAGLYEPGRILSFAEYPAGRKEAVYAAIADTAEDYELYQSRQKDLRDQLNLDLQLKLRSLFEQSLKLALPDSNMEYLQSVVTKLTPLAVQ